MSWKINLFHIVFVAPLLFSLTYNLKDTYQLPGMTTDSNKIRIAVYLIICVLIIFHSMQLYKHYNEGSSLKI